MLKMIKQKRAYVFAAVISLSLAVALLFFMASRGATKPSLKIAEGFGTYNAGLFYRENCRITSFKF